MQISIVLPVYNEEDNICEVIEDCIQYCATSGIIARYEIIVVNDGSTDQTAVRVVEKSKQVQSGECIQFISHTVNQGYGAALATGFKAAKYEWVFYMDSDRQFSITDLSILLTYAREHFELKYGTYLLSGIRVSRRDGLIRYINAAIYNTALKVLFGIRTKDINCAFKLIPKSFLSTITFMSKGATINAEMYFEARKKHISIIELPVVHHPRLAGKQTGANLKVVLRAMWALVRLRIDNWLK